MTITSWPVRAFPEGPSSITEETVLSSTILICRDRDGLGLNRPTPQGKVYPPSQARDEPQDERARVFRLLLGGALPVGIEAEHGEHLGAVDGVEGPARHYPGCPAVLQVVHQCLFGLRGGETAVLSGVGRVFGPAHVPGTPSVVAAERSRAERMGPARPCVRRRSATGAHGRCAPDLTLKTLPRTHHVGRIPANAPRRLVGWERPDVGLPTLPCKSRRPRRARTAAAHPAAARL